MLKEHLKNDMYADDQNAINAALKALEESENGMSAKDVHFLLEDIKAEVLTIPQIDSDGHNNNWYREPQEIIDDVIEIIDKYGK